MRTSCNCHKIQKYILWECLWPFHQIFYSYIVNIPLSNNLNMGLCYAKYQNPRKDPYIHLLQSEFECFIGDINTVSIWTIKMDRWVVYVLARDTSDDSQGESLVISKRLHSEKSSLVVTLVWKDNLVHSNLKEITTPSVIYIDISLSLSYGL